MGQRIGVLGGTFDPVHLGHLAAAEAVREELGLGRVLFVPAGRPPHKDPARITPAEHRYRMTVLATAGNPGFRVTRMEIDRPGPSYTVDTLRQLAAQLPAGTELIFITGVDAFVDVRTWREPDELFRLSRFAVVRRPGFDGGRLEEALGALAPWQRDRVHCVDATGLEISSRDLRSRVRAGRSIRYLVPDAVLAYIAHYGLYRGGGEAGGDGTDA
jgi:nicotinate-nucleotide adenylyltransferase